MISFVAADVGATDVKSSRRGKRDEFEVEALVDVAMKFFFLFCLFSLARALPPRSPWSGVAVCRGVKNPRSTREPYGGASQVFVWSRTANHGALLCRYPRCGRGRPFPELLAGGSTISCTSSPPAQRAAAREICFAVLLPLPVAMLMSGPVAFNHLGLAFPQKSFLHSIAVEPWPSTAALQYFRGKGARRA